VNANDCNPEQHTADRMLKPGWYNSKENNPKSANSSSHDLVLLRRQPSPWWSLTEAYLNMTEAYLNMTEAYLNMTEAYLNTTEDYLSLTEAHLSMQ